ncbi:MAG: alpha/beta fold hydrolase [Pirellulales bacterium]
MLQQETNQSEGASCCAEQRRQLAGERQWDELYPFAPHFITLPAHSHRGKSSTGYAYHYVDEMPSGESTAKLQTLLFVHGNPTWSFHWRRLVGQFQHQFRCVAPDHLGCGYSEQQPHPLQLVDHIDNLVQLIEQLDLQQITLVAQDWGGAIGLGAAQRLNKRFERLVLFNTGAYPPWFIPWRIRACRGPLLGRVAVQGLGLFSRAALRMTLGRTARLDPRVEQAYLAPYDSWQRRAAVYQFVRDIPTHESHPTWRTLAEIEAALPLLADQPKLLVWGMRDWCFTPACLDKFTSVWPQAEVSRLADAGHWVVEDAPDEVAQKVGDFLARTG